MSRNRAWATMALVALAAAVVLLSLARPAAAAPDVAGWTYKDLSSLQVGPMYQLAFDQGRIAWTKDEANGTNIFLADIGTGAVAQITDSARWKYCVAVSGDWLAWVESLGSYGDTQLLLRNLVSDDTRTIPTRYVSQDSPPQIVAGRMAWQQYEPDLDGRAGTIRLYVYDIVAASTSCIADNVVTYGGGFDNKFDLGPSQIAYLTYASLTEGETRGVVWLYDFNTGVRTKLGTCALLSGHISLEGDLITWAAPVLPEPPHYQEGDPPEPLQIMLHKISTGETRMIADRQTSSGLYPSADGRFVVWAAHEGKLMQVKAYDSVQGQLVTLSQAAFSNYFPIVSEGLVVWERGEHGSGQLMVHDLLSGQTTQLSTSRDLMNRCYQAKGREIVWWMEDGSQEGYAGTLFLVATAPPTTQPDPFADVSGAHRFRTAILGMDERGVATGYQEGGERVFRPEAALLRGQFAKMICEAFDVPVDEQLTFPFTDLGPDDPASLYPHEYIAALAGLGIVQGKTPVRFDPYGPLTRGQAVTILVRALDIDYPGLLTPLQAQPPLAYFWQPPHRASLRRAYANDLLVGLIDEVNLWGAYSPCTRGEAAQMIWNALSLIDQEGL
jgi:hypothetical protein